MTFEEEQDFRHSKLWMLLLIALIPIVSTLAVSSRPLISVSAILFLLAAIVFLYYAKLVVKVEDGYISIRFFPVHFFNPRKVYLTDIESFEAEEYSPLKEFGGWGWRWLPFRDKTAYSVEGEQCVRLTMEDETEIVIGSQKPEELEEAISEAK